MKRITAMILCLMMLVSLCGCTMLDYKKAVMLYEAGGYEGAKELFESLGQHKDSAEYAFRAGLILDYRRAVELYAEEDYPEAKELFATLGDFESSRDYLNKIEDRLITDKLVGRWESEEVDMTELFLSIFAEEMYALGFGDIEPEQAETVSLIQYYEFEEHGMLKAGYTEDSLSQFLAVLARQLKQAMLLTVEQDLSALAAEYGTSYEELLAALEVGDAQGYLEIYVLGMGLEEFLDSFYNSELFSSESTEISGAWYVKDGKIYSTAGVESEVAEYNADSDSVTVISNSMEEYNQLYPYELRRAGNTSPAA